MLLQQHMKSALASRNTSSSSRSSDDSSGDEEAFIRNRQTNPDYQARLNRVQMQKQKEEEHDRRVRERNAAVAREQRDLATSEAFLQQIEKQYPVDI